MQNQRIAHPIARAARARQSARGPAMIGLVTIVCAYASPARAQTPAPSPAPAPAAQASPSDVDALRQELETLKREYEGRIADLERRLGGARPSAQAPETARRHPRRPPPPPPPAEAAPAPPPDQAGQHRPLPRTGAPARGRPVPSGKVFNPDIAVIGNFLGAAGTNHDRRHAGAADHEAEASFQAVVDPYARGDFFISFGPDGAEVEEGFITFTSAARRPAARSARCAGVRQGEHDAHARAAVDRSAARDAQPGRRRGGHLRRRASRSRS